MGHGDGTANTSGCFKGGQKKRCIWGLQEFVGPWDREAFKQRRMQHWCHRVSDRISEEKCFARLCETDGSEGRASIRVGGFEDVLGKVVLAAHVCEF